MRCPESIFPVSNRSWKLHPDVWLVEAISWELLSFLLHVLNTHLCAQKSYLWTLQPVQARLLENLKGSSCGHSIQLKTVMRIASAASALPFVLPLASRKLYIWSCSATLPEKWIVSSFLAHCSSFWPVWLFWQCTSDFTRAYPLMVAVFNCKFVLTWNE